MFQWFGDVIDFLRIAWHFRSVLWQGARFFENDDNAPTLVALLQSRGAFFLKLGQWLGQRPDVVPQAFCQHLKRLQTAAPQHSWLETLQVCDNVDLRRYMDFADIDPSTHEPQPFSSGSIAQVYRVRTTAERLAALRSAMGGSGSSTLAFDPAQQPLTNSTTVFWDEPAGAAPGRPLRLVFKVCHPGVAQTFARSLRTVTQLYLFAQRILGAGSTLAMINIHDVVATEMQRQCDLLCEARHGQQLRRNFANNPYVRVPHIYLASSQCLFEEYVENAMFFDEIAPAVPSANGAGGVKDTFQYASDEQRQDTRLLAKEITMAAFLQMILYDGCSHGDCHSGNILYQLTPKRDDVYRQQIADARQHAIAGAPVRVSPVDICVWFLDFGIVVDIDDNLRETMLQLTVSINASDPLLMARAFERVLHDRDRLSPDALQRFEADCVRTNRLLRERDKIGPGTSLRDQISLIVENFRVHRLRIEAAALRVIISWLLIDENTPVRGPDDNLPDNTLRWITFEDTDDAFHLHEITAYIIGARMSRLVNEKSAHGAAVDSPQFRAPELQDIQRRQQERRQHALSIVDVLERAAEAEEKDDKKTSFQVIEIAGTGDGSAQYDEETPLLLRKRSESGGGGGGGEKRKRRMRIKD